MDRSAERRIVGYRVDSQIATSAKTGQMWGTRRSASADHSLPDNRPNRFSMAAVLDKRIVLISLFELRMICDGRRSRLKQNPPLQKPSATPE
jgi:hypothetical protein